MGADEFAARLIPCIFGDNNRCRHLIGSSYRDLALRDDNGVIEEADDAPLDEAKLLRQSLPPLHFCIVIFQKIVSS